MIRTGWKIIRIAILLGMIISCASFVPDVQAKDQEGSFVYTTNHFDGLDYSSSLVPTTVDSMYMLADIDNAITPRFTSLYYWPLTSEYKADWEKINVVLDGMLEIVKNNSLVAEIPQTDYVIQYDNFDKANTLKLYSGEAAVNKYDEFIELRKQYRDDLFAYDKAMTEYRAEIEKALKARQEGTNTEVQLPSQPAAPKDLSLFSTNMLRGYIVNLPEGVYTLRLRLPDGTIQPGSEKSLQVFTAIEEGIGYEIISSERWTTPDYSHSTRETIYTVTGKQLYLKPFWQRKYNEKLYTRMNNPQDTTSRTDRTVWIPSAEKVQGALRLEDGKSIEMEGYRVVQTAGSALGYEILKNDPASGENATFIAFALSSPGDFHNRAKLWLADEDNQSISGSVRDLRVLNTNSELWITLLGLIPLAVGSVVYLVRNLKVKKRK